MPKASIITIFLYAVLPVCAQSVYEDKSYPHQITLSHDNDFFMLTDYYYSSGLFISYTTILKNSIIKNYEEQVAFTLGQEIYTPSQTKSKSSKLFDRPYAGFLGLSMRWSAARKNHMYSIKLLTGLSGPNSGAGGFQRWYHQAIAISDAPLWVDELNNSFHYNVYLDYNREWTVVRNPFGIRFAITPNIAIGSKDIFMEPSTMISFGRRTHLSKSIAFDQLGSNEREIYFALRFGYRAIFHNGLIEGNLISDSSPITKNTTKAIYRFGFDFNHRFNQHTYKFGLRFNSEETPTSSSHKYVVLSYGLSF